MKSGGLRSFAFRLADPKAPHFRTVVYPDFDGNRVAGAPGFVAATHVNHAVPVVPGLTLGAGAKFTGNTSLRPAGDIKVPGYMLYSLGHRQSDQSSLLGIPVRGLYPAGRAAHGIGECAA